MSHPLEQIRPLAEKIIAELLPFCERAEIAGSIRRARPHCNDIDLVVLPKEGQLYALRERCKKNCDVVIDGDQNLIVRTRPPKIGMDGIQIDIFIADRPSADLFASKATNYGSLMVCRTGSIAHNIFLVERAKRMGLVWNPYYGVFQSGPPGVGTGPTACIASVSEEDIFKVLELEFVAPEKRER